MNNKLICPFCQQELRCDNTWNEVYMCRNPKCKHLLGYGTKELWQALIDTKNKLDMTADVLRHADWFFDGDYNVSAKDMHNEVRFAIKALEQINNKEQQ